MPANRDLKAKFKPHIGRTFILRKVSVLPGYMTGKAILEDSGKPLNRAEALGEAVLVLDETNTRVCVVTATGQSIWIQKYYLHKELPSQLRKKQDSAAFLIALALDTSRDLRNLETLTAESKDRAIRTLEEIAASLRSLFESEI